MEKIASIAARIKPEKSNGSAPPPPKPKAERVTLDTLDPSHHPAVKKAIDAARAWSSRKISGVENASLVLVAGPVKGDPTRTGYGCGKTHIARAIQWSSYAMLEDGTPVAPAGKFFTAADLLELLGSGNTIRELVPPAVDTIHGRVGGTPVLVIDDVGTEGVLPFVAKEAQGYERQTRYFRVINYCYEHKISVVITGNMRLSELQEHIGGRAWSRLLEMAPAGFMIDLTGVPDYRRKTGGR